MKSFEAITPADWALVMDRARASIERAPTLEAAAQAVTREIYESYPESTVLARMYYTIPYADLGDNERAFVDALAAKTGGAMRAETPILTLLGTYGEKESWRSRASSNGHLALPLISASFVEGIPMLAQLLKELGFDLGWLDRAPELHARKLLGGFNGVFYVEDAKAVRDARGRLVIPAQDFVDEHGVASVFGMGGFYPDGSLIACIVFTRETLKRPSVEVMKTLITTFKGESFGLIRSRLIFSSPPITS